MQLAERYAEQRTQIAEVQRVARSRGARAGRAHRSSARAGRAQTTASTTQATPGVRDASVRAEAELPSGSTRRRRRASRAAPGAERIERARVEERIAQRLAERAGAARLHEQSRAEAAAHAPSKPSVPRRRRARPSRGIAGRADACTGGGRGRDRLAAAELQAFIGQRPDAPCTRSTSSTMPCAASSCSRVPPRAARLRIDARSALDDAGRSRCLVAAIERAHAIADQPRPSRARAPDARAARLAQGEAMSGARCRPHVRPRARCAFRRCRSCPRRPHARSVRRRRARSRPRRPRRLLRSRTSRGGSLARAVRVHRNSR